jgi:copper chaperone
VESFDISLEKQQVVVRGNVTPEAVVEKVSKTGKKTELVSSA